MLAESKPMFEAQELFEGDMVFDIARTVFGITPESIADDENFVRAVFHAICERFVGITVNDIQQAFLTHEPKEKVYVLSRKDFIEPIQQYWTKKMIVIRELAAVQEKVSAEENIQSDVAKFRRESIDLYVKCLNSDRIWTGTEVQANSFAKEAFAHNFQQHQKDEIWAESKREYHQRREAINQNDPFALPPPPPEKIFSRRIVEEALRRNMFIAID